MFSKLFYVRNQKHKNDRVLNFSLMRNAFYRASHPKSPRTAWERDCEGPTSPQFSDIKTTNQ